MFIFTVQSLIVIFSFAPVALFFHWLLNLPILGNKQTQQAVWYCWCTMSVMRNNPVLMSGKVIVAFKQGELIIKLCAPLLEKRCFLNMNCIHCYQCCWPVACQSSNYFLQHLLQFLCFFGFLLSHMDICTPFAKFLSTSWHSRLIGRGFISTIAVDCFSQHVALSFEQWRLQKACES